MRSIQSLLPRLNQNARQDGLRETKFLGKRIYELKYFDWVNNRYYIPMTGAAITSLFQVNIPHRLIALLLKHVDTNDADAVTAFTWSFKRDLNIPGKQLFSSLASYTGSIKTDFHETFGEGFPTPSNQYQLIANTTNTHRIYLTMQIQLLGGV